MFPVNKRVVAPIREAARDASTPAWPAPQTITSKYISFSGTYILYRKLLFYNKQNIVDNFNIELVIYFPMQKFANKRSSIRSLSKRPTMLAKEDTEDRNSLASNSLNSLFRSIRRADLSDSIDSVKALA